MDKLREAVKWAKDKYDDLDYAYSLDHDDEMLYLKEDKNNLKQLLDLAERVLAIEGSGIVPNDIFILKALVLLCIKRQSSFKFSHGKDSKMDYCDGIITRERSLKMSAGFYGELASRNPIIRLWDDILSDDLIRKDAVNCLDACRQDLINRLAVNLCEQCKRKIV